MTRRRTNVTVTAAATVTALWLGLTAPNISPVASPPPTVPAPTTAVAPSPVPASAQVLPTAVRGRRR